MITCTLGDKKYTIDKVTGRALREIGAASKMYSDIIRVSNAVLKGEEIEDNTPDVSEALDVMVKWFCVLFQNQFTVDEVYDNYPADRIVHDLALAITAVHAQTTEVLSEFPTKAAQVNTRA